MAFSPFTKFKEYWRELFYGQKNFKYSLSSVPLLEQRYFVLPAKSSELPFDILNSSVFSCLGLLLNHKEIYRETWRHGDISDTYLQLSILREEITE